MLKWGGGAIWLVAPVIVVGVAPFGASVALVWFEGDHSCPGWVLVGHGVKEDEDDLVSIVVHLVGGSMGCLVSLRGLWVELLLLWGEDWSLLLRATSFSVRAKMGTVDIQGGVVGQVDIGQSLHMLLLILWMVSG